MSVVSIKRPVLSLPKQLREPGGLPLVEAVAAAHRNLKSASSGYLTALAQGIMEISALAAAATADFDETLVRNLYAQTGNLIGIASVCGLPSIDEGLVSLCDLLDQFQMRRLWDSDAVAVHVDALRLLIVSPQLEGKAGAGAILDGLHRVSRKYVAEQPPAER